MLNSYELIMSISEQYEKQTPWKSKWQGLTQLKLRYNPFSCIAFHIFEKISENLGKSLLKPLSVHVFCKSMPEIPGINGMVVPPK